MDNKPVRGESEVPSLAMNGHCYKSIRGEKAETNMDESKEQGLRKSRRKSQIENLAEILITAIETIRSSETAQRA